jgi:hypothetical protein
MSAAYVKAETPRFRYPIAVVHDCPPVGYFQRFLQPADLDMLIGMGPFNNC